MRLPCMQCWRSSASYIKLPVDETIELGTTSVFDENSVQEPLQPDELDEEHVRARAPQTCARCNSCCVWLGACLAVVLLLLHVVVLGRTFRAVSVDDIRDGRLPTDEAFFRQYLDPNARWPYFMSKPFVVRAATASLGWKLPNNVDVERWLHTWGDRSVPVTGSPSRNFDYRCVASVAAAG